MQKIPAMVDMRRTPAEKAEVNAPSVPDYPYGLAIRLTQDELDKLGLDGDVNIGDMLHLHCLSKVTSVSKNDSEASGPQCCVELQIVAMVGESEDDEDAKAEPALSAAARRSKLYGG